MYTVHHCEQEPIHILTDLLSYGDRTKILGIPWQLDFAGQNAREDQATHREKTSELRKVLSEYSPCACEKTM